MIPRVSSKAEDRLRQTLEALRSEGCVVLEHVFGAATLARVRESLYRGLELVSETVGAETLDRAGELGVVRAPMLSGPVFFELIAAPEILEIIDATLSPTAIIHLQNGFVLPPAQPGDEERFQRRFHRDFPRVLNGYLCSINTLIAVDEFTTANGATVVVPRTHQRAESPEERELNENATATECAAGDVIVFDSTLCHAAGLNASGTDRCAVNQQYTRSYFKQQIDYVRCLGNEVVERQPPRVQQLLGWYTRVPANLDEYYKEDRVYRAGQG
ncbi:MAG TPA: phytanoyl-CoA dioxygenase family protein [Thermoanaerobaculia bacterium]|nr:phytanoyl-CoA dioxygenase family protein [Thermoanaerobaculia bacterium]